MLRATVARCGTAVVLVVTFLELMMPASIERAIASYLLFWARFVVRSRRPLVIGVTGSVGKTTTKEVIAAALSHRDVRPFVGDVYKTVGNMNNTKGVPLMVLLYPDWAKSRWQMARWLVAAPFRALALATVRPYPKVLVLEFAAGPKGDIRRTAGAATPLISVVTAVGPAHLEGFGTIDRIVEEKSTLVRLVPPEGLVVLGAENAHASGMDRLARGRVVKVPGRGRQLSENAARAICAFLNIPADVTERALAERPVVHGRLHELDLGHFTVIDDSYNANPLSMELGLESLAQRPPRRVAILGDMKELGPDSARYHQEIGRFARPRCELLVGVGPLAREYNPDEWFATSGECIAALERLVQPGDCVLLKGSHSIRLGEVLHGLKVLARNSKAA